jgi:peptidoglycan/xylan/chitin deacetylase (PgdA/CDA1 family)
MAETRETIVVVSIDTEEDNWYRSRTDIAVQNILEIRRLAPFLDRLGVRPTYFTTYQVAIEPRAADTLREACDDGTAEIGAHLHPWNTPPLTEAFVPPNSMTKNLAPALQLAKIQRLTRALEDAFGGRPRAFRAGRYGLGGDTVSALLCCGYEVDSSVNPFTDLKAMDDGPNFVGAPLNVYRIGWGGDPRRPNPKGELLEVPLSCGFSRGPFSFWDPARRMLERAPLRWLRLAGAATRAGIVKRLVLCPELASVDEMLTLSRRLLEHGVRHLHISWHSPTLMPGLGPFAATAKDVSRLYGSVDAYFDGLSRLTTVKFATVTEAAALLSGRNMAGVAQDVPKVHGGLVGSHHRER